MRHIAVAARPSGRAPRVQALGRIVAYLILLVVACANLCVGWRGTEIDAEARGANPAAPGETSAAYRLAVDQAYAEETAGLGFYTWVSGMTGFYAVSFGFLFAAALALVGHVPVWWARGAITLAVLVILLCWPYVDLMSRLWVQLD